VTRTDGWLRCRKENGAAASEPCCRSECCFMVGIQHGSNRIRGRGTSVARDGGLPSDLLQSIDRSKRLFETEEVRMRDGVTNKSPYKRRPWERSSAFNRWWETAKKQSTWCGPRPTRAHRTASCCCQARPHRVSRCCRAFPCDANRYTLRFEPDHLPLVNAFWSLTLYELPSSLRNVSTTLRQPAFEFKLGFPAFGLAG
jgi:hypothetical protein